ncbi:MAG TPA: C40 family peptidase [Mycetocola sp.]|jgi:cell wall-associated NlpC family hydrolase|uniref:C40 family peptidase n=1 Tax=Mycetocola sp. TaxID=1871042 RepID=UPI00260F41BC|nr:C40 family peptidase [Mycetocola sp.]MCU1561393.1 Cell wall-associated hydrolase, NlpC family [Mycetocola sp.]HEV7848763.1 C40 family peptidase [Mycetocola sp.]
MSLLEATGRISEIQSTLLALTPGARANIAPSVAPSPASTDFAKALSDLTSTTKPEAVGTPLATGDATGAGVVAAAKKYLGVPYVFGGEDSTGMDCSGLVQRVYADLGITVPRVVPDQAKVGTEVGSLANAQPGDLIVAKGSGHILIYAGNNQVIHAPRPGTTVTLTENWRKDSDIETIRRLVPSTTAAPAAASAGNVDSLLVAAQRAALTGGSW